MESSKQVKGFRTDGGGEYTFKKFVELLELEGIINTTTMSYSPQSNGVVERVNSLIMKHMRCMLHNAGRSKKYWPLVVSVVVYLKNRSLIRLVFGQTPYEACDWRKAFMNDLRVFRCVVFVQVPK
jgi:hypothetical protein